MKSGKILHRFTAKDGREVVLRTPRWEDLDDFVELFNSLVDARADIIAYQKVTREEEASWLARKLVFLEKDEGLILVAEVEGKVVADAVLEKKKGISSHAGELGIIVMDGYQNVGVGTEMLKTLIGQAKEMGLKMLYLGVFSTNKRAYHVYTKVGFKETGRRPKRFFRNGKYIDDVIMTKELF
ncbi:MAG: GNAT family N-acetyltransferase [Candidatus Bathyarchaeota archaeon]|nr:GNAT family N-acetyltransferase [Candidatus Bathyarchaeota archaeon]